ncbi:hypothetical protein [Actinocrispum sp. NPDC049592]|uniref:hypothetical protein n=1 Tax=Actinocrispum sp. NPDC049592 TaxID=3154835 RepID=UPI00343E4D96
MNDGDDAEARRRLIARIERRRAEVDEFLDHTRPRSARLGVVSVVSSALAAVFTAGPAVGGEGFAGAVKDSVGFATDSVVWRLLCYLALAVSVVAAVCTNLLRSQNHAGKVTAAEAANAELDSLRTMLEFGHINLDPALRMYQQSIAKVAFVDEKLNAKAAA